MNTYLVKYIDPRGDEKQFMQYQSREVVERQFEQFHGESTLISITTLVTYTRVDDIFETHRDLIDELVGERCPTDTIVDRIREEADISEDEANELHDTIATYRQK